MRPAAMLEAWACDCWRGGGIVQLGCLAVMAQMRPLRDQTWTCTRQCHTQSDKRVSLLVIQLHP